MEVMFLNGVNFSIEFAKLILVVAYLFRIKVKKSIYGIFGVVLTGVMLVSPWFDMSEYSVIYAILIFVIFLLTLYEKKNIGWVILSYIGISIIDMLFSIVCIHLFDLTMKQVQEEYLLLAKMNSISLIVIIIFVLILRLKNIKNKKMRRNIYLPIFVAGGLFLSLYLTYTQMVGLEDTYTTYQNGLVISAMVITFVYFLICYLLMENQSKNHYLKMENDMNQKLLQSQKDYYSMLLKKEAETKMFRHDIKEHIICMQMLYEKKQYDKLGDYLQQIASYTKELSSKISTGNMYTDIIVADLTEQFSEVNIEWVGGMPEVTIASMDICTLFYNLLKNALEAAQTTSDKTVKVIIKTQEKNLMIEVLNSYEELAFDEEERLKTTKQGEGHGYGLKNIEKCVQKYAGSYEVEVDHFLFRTEIIVPNAVIKETQDER